MDDLIDDLTKIPLSGDDLVEISVKLGAKKEQIAWITYSALDNISSINELFKDAIKCVFILIQPKQQNIGHWTLLYKNKKGLGYYDPYGLSIDTDAKIAMSDRLPMLLKNLQVDQNQHKHQKFGTDKKGDEINTCGRHTATRCRYSFLDNDEYNQKIIVPPIREKQVGSPDVMVNLLTGMLSDSDNVIDTFIMKGKDPLDLPVPGREDLRIGGSRISHTSIGRGGVVFS